MDFDIRTILAAIHVIAWINFCIMLLAWYNAKALRRVTSYWTFGQALYGIGTLLLVLRNMVPDTVSVIIANACLVGAKIAVQEGLARYVNRDGYLRKLSFGVLIMHIISIWLFTYLVPSVPFRIVVYGLSTGMILAVSIKTLWTKDSVMDAPRKFLVLVMGFGIAILVARSAFAIGTGYFTDLMHAGLLQAVGLIGLLLSYVSLSIALFWLVVHRLGSEIQRQAMTDSLTNVGNRRALDELMEKQVPVKSQDSIGIMMIDIDCFKEINDRFGHQAGDRYLIEFSRIIKQQGDAFRYAGDEFIVVMYNLESSALMEKAECIRREVEDLSIPWLDQGCIKTTVSIGLAIADSNTKSWDELVRQADNALYSVKHKDGNHIGVAGPV